MWLSTVGREVDAHQDEMYLDKIHRNVSDQFPFKTQFMGGHGAIFCMRS